MNLNQINVGQLLAQIASLVQMIVGYGLLLLIAAAVLGKYGVRVPYVPTQSASDLAWICGAWWLYRGGKI